MTCGFKPTLCSSSRTCSRRSRFGTKSRLRDAQLAVDRIRNAERAECGLERSAQALDARADDADALGRRAGAQQREDLLSDELQGAARPRTLEEANGAVAGSGCEPLVREQGPLDVRESGLRNLGIAGWQLFHVRAGEPLQILGRAAERREGRPAGLVGQRDAPLGPAGQPFEERPPGAGEVLEA